MMSFILDDLISNIMFLDKFILCKSLLSLWFTTIHKMQVVYTMHETSAFPFLLKAISMQAISIH